MIRKAIGYTAVGLWVVAFVLVMAPLVMVASWGLYGEDGA